MPGGDRSKTVAAALEEIIPYLRDRGFHFVSTDELLHTTRNALMPALTGRELWYAQIDRNVFDVIFSIELFLRVAASCSPSASASRASRSFFHSRSRRICANDGAASTPIICRR